jgi:AAA ATPase domain
MTPISGKNPYRPGVGTKPAYLAGREAALRRFEALLRGAPEQPANLRLTGLRGVGKTVLLAEYAEKARQAGWTVASLELTPRHLEEAALVQAVVAKAERLQHELSRAAKLRSLVGRAARAASRFGISYSDVKVALETEQQTQLDLGRTLFDTVAATLKSGRAGFLLLLDEAQTLRDERERGGEHPLSLLVATISAFQRLEPPVPIGLVVAGLPTLRGNLLRARSYTERMFRGEEVGRLDAEAARAAFVEPLRDSGLSVSDELVAHVIDEVEGYPYFIQLWGAELWDAAFTAELTHLDHKLLRVARPDIYRRLDIDFYEPRISTLTPAEQDLLLGTERCPYPPIRSEDLVTHVDKTPGNINVLLGRLVEAGVLYRLRKGEYEYTAPKFRQYLRRRATARA